MISSKIYIRKGLRSGQHEYIFIVVFLSKMEVVWNGFESENEVFYRKLITKIP